MKKMICLTINGKEYELAVAPNMTSGGPSQGRTSVDGYQKGM
jgi:hypothetical protein